VHAVPQDIAHSGSRALPWPALVLLLIFAPGAAAQSNSECLACHSDPALTKTVNGKEVPVHVDPAKFDKSVHGIFGCADCHTGVKEYPHEPAPARVSCAQCHEDAVTAHAKSVHGKAYAKGNGQAPGCTSCHGDAHAILSSSDEASATFRTRIPETCGTCHSVKFVMESGGLRAQPFFSYRESVHGKAVAAGSSQAAVCTDCHRSHDILNAADPASRIFKFNVPSTCGQCHAEIAEQFKASIHGQGLARGNWQSAVCTDCHGIHLIKPHIDPSAPPGTLSMARAACANCHEGVRLSDEFGVASRRASTYLDSYHGMASKLGSKVVANCASCHGVHNIFPSSDPRSTIHPANLVQTCGQCHPGAGVNFAASKIHLEVPLSRDMGSRGTAFVRRLYLVLIFVLIGGMALHNLILWRRKALLARQRRGETIVRLSLNQRVQHWVLLSSFITLAVTGFALTYPDSWLAWLLGSSEAFRRILHRIAGVALIGLGVYHLAYSAFTAEGRQAVRDFLPARQDVRDVVLNLRHHLGLSLERPRFSRLTYADKAEYWALVWGTILMGLTGLMMWFPVAVTRLLPRWAVDIATAIHFYEAVLAVLAIVVWHFYFVIFDPDVYPLNWAFWDGKMSAEHYREHHPRYFEQLQLAEAEAEAPQDTEPEASKPGPDGGSPP
jgi:formate dehydrogenase gamma subunit